MFPEGVLLGELPKDKKLRGNERFGWNGNQYFLDADLRHQAPSRGVRHFPANKIRGYVVWGEVKSVDGFGVFIDRGIVQFGEISGEYVGAASTIFELQDLIGVPRVKPSDGSDGSEGSQEGEQS